ncbi:MAG: hypothetical protein BWY24_00249 [Microgenomates group bacterium ADurb.Bin219]|nr:MAG: hypothetical protein BWY24_00249 [Microgenomates group bacterium ADurb.Bin219]HNP89120.1 hypothetical protein [Candidatus Woesebacteria bacterium]
MVSLIERITERTKPEAISSSPPPEVTPQNITQVDFRNLNWLPYFSGEHLFGPVENCPELQPNESLNILIPEFAVRQRVEAVAGNLAGAILADPGKFSLGAIREGGLWFYEQLMKKVEEISPWGRKTVNAENHLDIKSRHATETGEYQVLSSPDPERVNGKTLILCEGVADTLQTITIAQEVLSRPPYREVNLRILLLLDKTGVHPGLALPGVVYPPLFSCGNVWVSGCGPDTDQRFRNLGCIAVYKKE